MCRCLLAGRQLPLRSSRLLYASKATMVPSLSLLCIPLQVPIEEEAAASEEKQKSEEEKKAAADAAEGETVEVAGEAGGR